MPLKMAMTLSLSYCSLEVKSISTGKIRIVGRLYLMQPKGDTKPRLRHCLILARLMPMQKKRTIGHHYRMAENTYDAVVKLLFGRSEIDINSKDGQGRTPLSLAAAPSPLRRPEMHKRQ